MIERLVNLCFQRRGIVQLVFLLAALYGWYCWNQLHDAAALEAEVDETFNH